MMIWRALALLVALAVVGCGTARRGPPAEDAPRLTEATMRGQSVFMTYCNQCHPGGEAGLGPAINNKPLPRFLMAFQVRNGLGVMPAFPQELISDSELDDLLDYLVALRSA